MKHLLRQQLCAGVLISAGFGTTSAALADTDSPAAALVEEIVVTARLRSESLAEVPVTVNAFSQQDIEDAGIRRPNDYLSLVPNVTLVEAQNAGTTFLTIRGITQVRNNEPPVAVSVDGMLQTSPNQFNQALLDMAQIEVLKGPQGALYGRNAIGGAINITTRGPSDEFSGRVQLGAGNGERFEGRASLAGPLAAGKAWYRIAASWSDRDGYLENVNLGGHVDPLEDKSMQLRLDWLLSDAWTADLRFYASNTKGGSLNYNWQAYDYELDAFIFAPGDANNTDLIYEQNNRGENDRDILEAAFKLEREASWGTLTSITSFNRIEEWYGSDQAPYSESLTQYPFGPGVPFDGVAQQYFEVDAFSQELRLTSRSDRPLRWLVGAYYVGTDRFISSPVLDDTGVGIVRVERRPTGAGEPATFSFLADDNDNSAFAVFGQLNYDVTDSFEASVALRYDEDERIQTTSPFHTGGAPNERRRETFDKLQPKVSLRYQLLREREPLRLVQRRVPQRPVQPVRHRGRGHRGRRQRCVRCRGSGGDARLRGGLQGAHDERPRQSQRFPFHHRRRRAAVFPVFCADQFPGARRHRPGRPGGRRDRTFRCPDRRARDIRRLRVHRQ